MNAFHSRNYNLSLSDSVAPESCTVLDIAQVAKHELIASALYDNGQRAAQPFDWLEARGEYLTDQVHEMLYAEAFDSFKSWAQDLNRFYNANKVKEILRDLFDAALTINAQSTKAEITSMINSLNDGDPQPMLTHWHKLHMVPSMSA